MGDPTPITLVYYVKCSLCLTQHLSFITLMLIAPGKMNFVLGAAIVSEVRECTTTQERTRAW